MATKAYYGEDECIPRVIMVATYHMANPDCHICGGVGYSKEPKKTATGQTPVIFCECLVTLATKPVVLE